MGREARGSLKAWTVSLFPIAIKLEYKKIMQADILNIFETAQGITGLTGWLRFQAAPPNFVDVFENVPESEIGLFV